ncbi:MAG: TetR/AcrR family transcriptional regulator [Pseudomonadota bacterium]
MTLFHERGYDGVGVAELAKEIGINPPSLYAAFGSKLGLFERAVERYADKDGGFITDVLDRSRNPEEAIRELFLQAADSFAADRRCPGCLVMDGARNSTDPDASALTATLRGKTRGAIAAWLAGQGLHDAGPLADALMIALAGLSAAARDGMPKDNLHAAAEVMSEGIIGRLEPAA